MTCRAGRGVGWWWWAGGAAGAVASPTLHPGRPPPRPASHHPAHPPQCHPRQTRRARLQDLVLLQHLARNVERQVLAVDDALDKAQPLGDQVLAVVHDEHPAHVELQGGRGGAGWVRVARAPSLLPAIPGTPEPPSPPLSPPCLDVVGLLAGVEQVEGGTLGQEQDGLELQLRRRGRRERGEGWAHGRRPPARPPPPTCAPPAQATPPPSRLTLHRKVLVRQGLLPVVGQGLVKGVVLLLGHLVGVAHPDRLLLVEQLPLVGDLGHLLGLLLLLAGVRLLHLALLALLVLALVGVNLLDLLVVRDLLLHRLLVPDGDGVGDELKGWVGVGGVGPWEQGKGAG